MGGGVPRSLSVNEFAAVRGQVETNRAKLVGTRPHCLEVFDTEYPQARLNAGDPSIVRDGHNASRLPVDVSEASRTSFMLVDPVHDADSAVWLKNLVEDRKRELSLAEATLKTASAQRSDVRVEADTVHKRRQEMNQAVLASNEVNVSLRVGQPDFNKWWVNNYQEVLRKADAIIRAVSVYPEAAMYLRQAYLSQIEAGNPANARPLNGDNSWQRSALVASLHIQSCIGERVPSPSFVKDLIASDHQRLKEEKKRVVGTSAEAEVAARLQAAYAAVAEMEVKKV